MFKYGCYDCKAGDDTLMLIRCLACYYHNYCRSTVMAAARSESETLTRSWDNNKPIQDDSLTLKLKLPLIC